ncbi:MAG: glycoside hydrolase family 97 protein [Bacteroidales bacterium]|nr:glycoside hydrolase family 97 protein [Bacteroidales bacterium]
MKRVIISLLGLALVALVSCGGPSAAEPTIVSEEVLYSPDSTLCVHFTLNSDGAPAYSLKRGDTDIVLPSRLGYTFRGKFTGAHAEGGRNVKDYEPALDISTGFRVADVSRDSFDETWETVWGEERFIRNHYNELAVTLVQDGFEATKKKQERGIDGKGQDDGQLVMVIRFRLYDDGLGLRYEFPEQEALTYFTVAEELTEFRMAGDHLAWWIPGDCETQEYNYTESRISEIPAKMQEATDYKDPRQFSASGVQTALQMRTDDGLYINIHEAALVNYPAMHLDYDAAANSFRSWLCPDAEGWKGHLQTPCKSPWRTVMVTDDARKVLESRLILNLNDPCAIEDTSWIHPVKYMGVWWEMITGRSSWSYTTDFAAVTLGETDYSSATPSGRHGANNENVRRYIDFAAANGFDGLLVEGWDQGWEDWYNCQKDAVFDFVTPYPDFDLPALNAYAHSKGIRLIMHHETSSSTANYERHLDEAFDLMNRYGYNSVKTGYVGNIIPFGEGHYSQPTINHYNYVLRKAAAKHIMINAHEAVRPTGLCRTWPNLVGNESARGTEYRGRIKPHHVTILPFTRLQGGPMDYTPGIFETDISRLNPASTEYMTTTIAKQLALYVTMYSPLQMAADLPEHYMEHPDAFQFIRDVAVDWEQSRYLIAEPGEVLVIARQVRKESLSAASRSVAALPDGKKGYVNGAMQFASGDKDVWFIGGVTDEKERTVTFALDFLQPGATYEATLYLDAPDASGIAGIQPDGSNPTKRYTIEKREVTAADTLTLRLAPSGGFAISCKEL